MYDNKEYIGKKIKEFRKKNKLSQAELAELIGLSDKHIGRIEAGLYYPSIKNFLNIMSVLKINFSDFGFDIEKNPENKEKAELIRMISASDDKEISLYLKMIKLLKEN